MNIPNKMIPTIDRWYSNAVQDDHREPNVVHDPVEENLYENTMDRVASGFERLSQLDQSEADSNPAPGQVEVTGEDGQVESLGRAPHGYAMTLTNRTFTEDGPDAYCNEVQTKFLINQNLGTIAVLKTEDVFYSPFEPRQHWGEIERAAFTLNLNNETVTHKVAG